MQILLSLPPNLVDNFHDLAGVDRDRFFCTSDPVGSRLGSGGGTTWLLDSWEKSGFFSESCRKIILHAGGHSRRLPAYAPSGKILTPVPVFRWARGQKLGQNLLSLQLPLYEKIMGMAPDRLTTLIASGDVYIRTEQPLLPVPDADVVCYGLWVDPALATRHGVFVSSAETPDRLDFMLQKPSFAELEKYSLSHLFLMDIGIWLLSDKAIDLLRNRSRNEDGSIRFYDLYSDFGRALGDHPSVTDSEVNGLKVAIVPLSGGEFYHYGTTRELLSSTLAVQNKVHDQRRILNRKIKSSPALFTQNSRVDYRFTPDNDNIWVENSHLPAGWKLESHHVVTGVPVNDWNLELRDGVCVDIVPVGSSSWAVRPYGFDDSMSGALDNDATMFLGRPVGEWMKKHGIVLDGADIQSAPLFPLVDDIRSMGEVLRWMVGDSPDGAGAAIWLGAKKISADAISDSANLERLFAQRREFEADNWRQLSDNYERSVFYQLDLSDVARQYDKFGIPKPEVLPSDAPPLQRIHNRMLRARIDAIGGRSVGNDESVAFGILREELMRDIFKAPCVPRLNIYSDQIVWGRSPVRIDLAGGWTDTPPYSLFAGGNVVNMAIELNGQPPLQVYVKPSERYEVVLRSIDMSASEVISTYEDLADCNRVGSPFSIPKAALILAGFSPLFADNDYRSLEEQLADFGSGIEITLLSAIPAGSGLGTSSILASTVLGALSDFCGLAWDENEICRRTLSLEQLLTTGGGWQDQYGGVLRGVKLLRTEPGFSQHPVVDWLPEQIFTSSEFGGCHLLYYTGITRTAKNILAEIVRSMFLNSGSHLSLLKEMKQHAIEMAQSIQRNDFVRFGQMVGQTWEYNKRLDPGTNPSEIQRIIDSVSDYTLGYKLPGAGGGGFLYMVAKDPEAASRIRHELVANAPNGRARFVDLKLSSTGFRTSRS